MFAVSSTNVHVYRRFIASYLAQMVVMHTNCNGSLGSFGSHPKGVYMYKLIIEETSLHTYRGDAIVRKPGHCQGLQPAALPETMHIARTDRFFLGCRRAQPSAARGDEYSGEVNLVDWNLPGRGMTYVSIPPVPDICIMHHDSPLGVFASPSSTRRVIQRI